MPIPVRCAAFLACAGLLPAAGVTITTLSSRPEMVSGGDVVVEIQAPRGKTTITLNGADVLWLFHRNERGSLIGLVTGLKLGENTLVAHIEQERATLKLVNHPITGPIVSGPHLKPFICTTKESGLGEPLDADCSAQTKVEYFYKPKEGSAFKPLAGPKERPADIATTTTNQGKTVPYVVKVESGTINRSIYRIAMLEDGAWNQRVIYSFGGGCGTQYNQGKNTAVSAIMDAALSRGFAHIISTQNVMNQHCNDHLSGEALMMIKEHFIKRYGVPVWTMGHGGSGGSIQQLLIAQNFPGLLDGLLPSLAYPDSMSTRPGVTDCRLLMRTFAKDPGTWTQEKQTAVEGYTPGTCKAWDRSFIDVIVAANAKGCAIAPELVYDPIKNPKGARCTIWEMNAATVGRDPATGYARAALDNVGVQYGLEALNTGKISKQEFLDLNRNIGGYDADGVPRAQRTAADLEALRMSYITGRINSGAGGLASVPILHYRPYNDLLGDIHDRFRDFVVRERLRKSNGRVDNQVIWTYPAGDRALAAKVSGLAIDTMTQWLDTKTKPAAAVDGCWTKDGARIDEPATFDGPGKCNELFPSHKNPRLVAGAPLTDDIAKCQLKPVNPTDYRVQFSAAEMQELRTIFPGGVCDYSKPGVMQLPLAGTYLTLPLKSPAPARSGTGAAVQR